MSASPQLTAVDGTGLYVRSSKAARHLGLTGPDGTPTGALTLFANSMAVLIRETSPDHIMIAWDSGRSGTEWRRRIVPGYKGNRPGYREAPGDYQDGRQFDAIRLLCDAAGFAQWAIDDFEADDLLGTFCRKTREEVPGGYVTLCSDDKDVLQLAEQGRVAVRYFGAAGRTMEARDVKAEWGVEPGVLPALRALMGDPSDGIPGLPGVGPFRAGVILREHGFAWPPPAEAVPDPALCSQALAWHDVMDLISPPERPEDHDPTGFLDIRKTAWERGNILPVLERYAMRSLAERWMKGALW